MAVAVPATPAKVVCPVAMPDEASALMKARWCGGKVEVSGDLSETIDVWANPNGTLTAEATEAPERIHRDGKWLPVDLTLQAQQDGSVAAKAHPIGLTLSGAAAGGDHDLVSLGVGDSALSVDWTGKLPAPVLLATRATYPEVRPGIDLVVEATRTGFEQYIVVKDKAAAAQVAELNLALHSAALTVSASSDGGLVTTDRAGKRVGHSAAPLMWDAAVSPKSGDRVRQMVVGMKATPDARTKRTSVQLTPDPAFFDDPKLQYPVTIDPSFDIASTFSTFVQTGYTTDQSTSTDLKLGYSDDGGSWVARSFLQWPTAQFAGKQILSASLSLWEYHSWSCTAARWDVWTTGAASTATRDTNQPAWNFLESSSTQTKGYSSSCNDGWVSADATSFIQRAANASASSAWMGLRAYNESDHLTWKRFNSRNAATAQPKITVNYNSVPVASGQATDPATSGCVTGSGRPFISSATPALKANVSDGEGTPTSVTFEWWAVGGSTAIGSATQSNVSSGATASATVPSGAFTEGNSYQWRVKASDGTATSAWSSWCEFTVDTTAPSATPGVSSATFPDRTWTGGAPSYSLFTTPQAYVNGTTSTGLSGDSGSVHLTIPFTFTYFGTAYTGIWATVDGRLTSDDGRDQKILPFEDDLYIDGSASVRTATIGTAPNRQFVIDYHNVYRNAEPTERFSFEALLGENGQITFNYDSLDTSGSKGGTANVGLGDAAYFYTWYSTWWASLTSGTAIVFTPSPSSVYDYTMTTAARTYTPASTVFNLTGDDAVASITPPFQLPLYGQKYSSMWVDTNGRISVQNNPPWNGAGFDVFHDDLLVDGSAAIRTSTTGTAPNRQFTVEWSNVTFAYNTTQRFDAEVIFSENSGDIVTDYRNLDTDNEKGADATVGIRDTTLQRGENYVSYQPLLANNTAVTFHPIPAVPFADSGTAASFTLSASGVADVASYQYGLDTNPPTTIVNAGSVGGSANVTITPSTDGVHTLYVRSVDRAGNLSPIKSYGVYVGYGAVTSPTVGTISAGKVTLSSVMNAYSSGITYQWRRGDADTWNDIPVTDITIPSGGAVTDWPYWPSTGTPPDMSWDLATTLNNAEAGPDPLSGPVQVRAVFAGNVAGETAPVKITFDRNRASAASTQVGPGSVNLLTGNYTLSQTDVSSLGLGVARTYATRQSTVSDPMFGPGWVSSVPAPQAQAAYTDLTVTGSLVQVGLPDGTTIGFAKATGDANGATYTPQVDDQSFTLTYTTAGDSFTLKDGAGNVVTFTHLATSVAGTYLPTAATPPGSSESTTYSWEKVTIGGVDVLRPTRILNPVAAGVNCNGGLVRGCQALTFTYATATTATGTASGTWGDYTGRLQQIAVTAWDPDLGTPAMSTVVLAKYAYDTNGRLRAQWYPRLDWSDNSVTPPATRHLQNTYDYDGNGILSTYTPVGQQPWTFAYTTVPADSGLGRLASVSRSALSVGTATTTVVYSVPLSGTGAPNDLSVGQTARWGQSQAPVDATAVFDPGEVPTGNQSTGTMPADWNRATVTYLDSNGRAVNTANPGGGIATTWYDSLGNVVQSLTPGNRQLALNTSGTDTAAQEAAIADRESTLTVYSSDGQQELQTLGPEHTVVLSSGTVVRGRARTSSTYDQGAPGTGGPYNLVTTTVEDVVYINAAGVQVSADPRTTTDGYDWNLRKQTIETVDPSGLALSTRTTYDAATGRVATVTAPAGGTTTNTPQTRATVYYTTAANGTYPECGGHAEWAQMVCRTQPGGQPGSGPEIPVRVTTYNMYGQPRVITEKTSVGTQRTTTINYDAAGRPATVSLNAATGLGTAVPTTRTVYDQASGQATLTQSLDSGNNVTAQIQRAYDALGRVYSYTDADGNITTTTYDLLSRTATTNDSKGTRTWTYDGGTERRDLPTSVLDSQAGTFTSTYDVDGNLASQSWPDNIVVTNGYNELGDATSVSYSQPGCGQANCTLYTQTVTVTAHRQTHSSSSPLSGQVYGYDADGRLTTVNDTRSGSCTTRTYGFNSASDRTGRTTYGPAADGSCQATTASATATWSYDTADRVSSGYTYDALGRVTAMPAPDTETPATGNETITYYADDMAHSLTQGDRTSTYALDVVPNRVRSWNDNAVGVVKTNHYADDADNPTWTDEGNASMSRVIRSVTAVADIFTNTTGNVWQITNLHGDLVAGVAETGTGLAYAGEYNESGQAVSPADAGTRRYGWLGQDQRAADNPGGTVLMGDRTYQPGVGRFGSVDSIPGSSANSYDYCNGDGVNCTDTSGNSPCRVTGTWNWWWAQYKYTWFRCDFSDGTVQWILDTFQGFIYLLFAVAAFLVLRCGPCGGVIAAFASLYQLLQWAWGYEYKYICRRHNGIYVKGVIVQRKWAMPWQVNSPSTMVSFYYWGCR
ncbi:MAG: hypothetical protein AUG44_10030 [Actinobacteria bacterium 13_1_20CM_3_71_11]|nr:MAG: hypothetical protein AUG44_10030 [Actinobacteria bacterium 13_1_20CM_3_71_11]